MTSSSASPRFMAAAQLITASIHCWLHEDRLQHCMEGIISAIAEDILIIAFSVGLPAIPNVKYTLKYIHALRKPFV
jgi:hypothetical protein